MDPAWPQFYRCHDEHIMKNYHFWNYNQPEQSSEVVWSQSTHVVCASSDVVHDYSFSNSPQIGQDWSTCSISGRYLTVIFHQV